MIDEFQFESCGATLEGRLSFPPDARETRAIVILLTGDSPSGLKSKTWPPMIAALNEKHIAVFAFDFLSQGYSGGDRNKLTLPVACRNLQDSLRAMSHRVKLSDYKVGFLGSSFGATVVLTERSKLGQCHAIALKSPASFLPEAYESEHGFPAGMDQWREKGISPVSGLPYQAYMEAVQQNVYPLVVGLSVPTLVVHGDADTVVPVSQSRRLCHLIGPAARLVELPGVNHDYKQAGAQDRMQKEIVSFFVKTLMPRAE